jgi:hypothetical protein
MENRTGKRMSRIAYSLLKRRLTHAVDHARLKPLSMMPVDVHHQTPAQSCENRKRRIGRWDRTRVGRLGRQRGQGGEWSKVGWQDRARG